jgi:hypothetical protein
LEIEVQLLSLLGQEQEGHLLQSLPMFKEALTFLVQGNLGFKWTSYFVWLRATLAAHLLFGMAIWLCDST